MYIYIYITLYAWLDYILHEKQISVALFSALLILLSNSESIAKPSVLYSVTMFQPVGDLPAGVH